VELKSKYANNTKIIDHREHQISFLHWAQNLLPATKAWPYVAQVDLLDPLFFDIIRMDDVNTVITVKARIGSQIYNLCLLIF